MISPKKVIPMHFKTFPILVQDQKGFIEIAKREAPGIEVVMMNPGEEYTYTKWRQTQPPTAQRSFSWPKAPVLPQAKCLPNFSHPPLS